jgi:hypothetical protein
MSKNRVGREVTIQDGAIAGNVVQNPVVAQDGLPIPHKRAQWSPAEVIKFVGVWNSASSMQEVVDGMNRSLAACYSMAKQCRKNGIQLKVLGRAAGLDWSSIKSALPGG